MAAVFQIFITLSVPQAAWSGGMGLALSQLLQAYSKKSLQGSRALSIWSGSNRCCLGSVDESVWAVHAAANTNKKSNFESCRIGSSQAKSHRRVQRIFVNRLPELVFDGPAGRVY